MKTLLASFAATILLCCFFAPSQGFAQNPDICKPDCDSSDFGSTQTTILTLPSGCIVRVEYAQRHACGIWNDVGIISVELLNDCFPTDPKSILDAVSEELIKQNPMGFPLPDSGKCTTSWRVVKGACWTKELDCDHDTLYVPCDTVACCLTPMTICRDSAGTITVIPHPGTVTAPCDTTKFGCEPVCGGPPMAPQQNSPDLGVIKFHPVLQFVHDDVKHLLNAPENDPNEPAPTVVYRDQALQGKQQ